MRACSQFDRFMQIHDLPVRSRDFDVTLVVDIAVTVTLTVSADSEDDATNRDFSNDEVAAAVADRFCNGGLADFVNSWHVDAVVKS